MRRLTFATALLVALATTGCSGSSSGASGGVSRERFVRTYVALREARYAAASAADFESRKSTILSKEGVTGAALEAFAKRHSSDPAYMQAVWDEVSRQLSGEPADSAAKAGPPARPGAIAPDSTRRPGSPAADSIRRPGQPAPGAARRPNRIPPDSAHRPR